MAMFGVIVSGQLVQTNFQQISQTQFITTIAEADAINHVVVFLTGAMPLPEGTVGLVYFSWPDPSAPPNWQLLGWVSNQKPSAIFKISSLKKLHEMSGANAAFGCQSISHEAQLGVSIESEAATAALPIPEPSYANFAGKMLEHFVNFVSSYAVQQAQMLPNPNETFVPLSTVQNWYQTFQRRLQNNPDFWKT